MYGKSLQWLCFDPLFRSPPSIVAKTLRQNRHYYPFSPKYHRQMNTKPKTGVPHQVRTAAEPRQNRLYTVRLTHVDELNPTVRLLQLTIPPNVQSLENDTQYGDVRTRQTPVLRI